MDKRLIIANGIGLLIIAGFLGYAVYQKQTPVPAASQPQEDDKHVQTILTDDGYAADYTLGKTPVINTDAPGYQESQLLLARKYNKRPDEITIYISETNDHYLRGNVTIGKGGDGNKGTFFASDTNGEWELVWDGADLIPCAPLEQYGFPDSMRWDCVE